jgi:hypothetical protein
MLPSAEIAAGCKAAACALLNAAICPCVSPPACAVLNAATPDVPNPAIAPGEISPNFPGVRTEAALAENAATWDDDKAPSWDAVRPPICA